jgi:hypothetical protein
MGMEAIILRQIWVGRAMGHATGVRIARNISLAGGKRAWAWARVK